MQQLHLISLLLLSFSGFTQNTVEISNPRTRESYEVLISDQNIKHGMYKKYGFDTKIRTIGFYKNGVQDSVWTFYDAHSEIIQKFDFAKDDVIYFSKNEARGDMKIKLSDSTASDLKLDRPPLFFGGSEAMYRNLAVLLRYPDAAIKAGRMGKVVIRMKLNQNGEASDFKIVKKLGYGLDQEALRVVQAMSINNWLPAIYKGKKVSVEFSIPIVFKLE
jgi:TonB family protein